jgi:hypothetical protein
MDGKGEGEEGSYVRVRARVCVEGVSSHAKQMEREAMCCGNQGPKGKEETPLQHGAMLLKIKGVAELVCTGSGRRERER